jgi:hypothetical protein
MSRQRTISSHRHANTAPLLLAILLLLAAATISSCSIGLFTRSLFGEKLDITVKVDSTANNEFPLAMTVLYVYDEETFKKLLAYSARQWYQERPQLEENNSDNSSFEAFDWEWIPGQDTTVSIPFRTSAIGAILFANYFTEGQYRVRINPYKDIRVVFGYDELKVEGLDPKEQ